MFPPCRGQVCITSQQLMRTRVYSVSQAAGCCSFRACGLWRSQVTDGRAGTKPESRNLQTHTHKHKSYECASAATSQCFFNSQTSSLILLYRSESSVVRCVLDSITLPSNTSQSVSTNGPTVRPVRCWALTVDALTRSLWRPPPSAAWGSTRPFLIGPRFLPGTSRLRWNAFGSSFGRLVLTSRRQNVPPANEKNKNQTKTLWWSVLSDRAMSCVRLYVWRPPDASSILADRQKSLCFFSICCQKCTFHQILLRF